MQATRFGRGPFISTIYYLKLKNVPVRSTPPQIPSCKLLESTVGFYTDIVPRDDISKRPTVAEILAHPSYPDTIWNLVPTQSGQLPVAAGRGGPFKVDWEVHGAGDIKLVVREIQPGLLQLSCANVTSRDLTDSLQWIMGLGSVKVRTIMRLKIR